MDGWCLVYTSLVHQVVGADDTTSDHNSQAQDINKRNSIYTRDFNESHFDQSPASHHYPGYGPRQTPGSHTACMPLVMLLTLAYALLSISQVTPWSARLLRLLFIILVARLALLCITRKPQKQVSLWHNQWVLQSCEWLPHNVPPSFLSG